MVPIYYTINSYTLHWMGFYHMHLWGVGGKNALGAELRRAIPLWMIS
jgi:hypothetical protein